MAVGAMGIVAPISAASPVVPLAVDAVGGTVPSTLQWCGIAIVLGGIVLLAREPRGERTSRVATGVVLAIVAALLAYAIDALAQSSPKRVALAIAGAAALFVAGAALDTIEWTTARPSPIAVTLVQGNIPQEQKFDPELRGRAFRIYTELVAASRGKLVVLPESAFPVFAEEVPKETVATLARIMRARSAAEV